MKASEFYRILSEVKGMEWQMCDIPPEQFGVPSRRTFFLGTREYCEYSPLSAVATAVKRKYVGIWNLQMQKTLNLDIRTFRRIQAATYQRHGYSPIVRRKLARACGLK